MLLSRTERQRIYLRNYAAKPGTRAKQLSRAKCLRAIKAGKLTRLPCEMCGKAKSEAHHEDYSKPFDVKWLCRQCHSIVHRGERKHQTSSQRPRKTHCARGHAMTGHNVMLCFAGEGYAKKRKCRQCSYERQKIRQGLAA